MVHYNDKDIKINAADQAEGTGSADGIVNIKGWTNQLTLDFMKDGYVILRNFIPKDIINMTLDSWLSLEHKPEWNDAFFAVEDDIIHDSPKDSLRKSSGCYSFPPAVALHRWLRDNLRPVIDMQLVETYAYTRKYERGAYLKAHSDRPSCEVSATICLKYKTDDNSPWKIWIQNDKNYVDLGSEQQKFYEEFQNIPHRDRKGIPIALEVGDLLLYQGPNAPHWRDYLLGDYSYHMFLHFINHGGKITHFDKFQKQKHDMGADGRPHSVFAYDGRDNRYSHEQSQQFKQAMKFWNDFSAGTLDERYEFRPSDFLNNYNYITEAEDPTKD